MSIAKKLVAPSFKVDAANAFASAFGYESFFLFAGKHIPYEGSDSSIPEPNTSIQSNVLDIYNNMIFSKKIETDDVIQMIPKYLWTEGEVYDEYSHIDRE